jgi:hypothetical protein
MNPTPQASRYAEIDAVARACNTPKSLSMIARTGKIMVSLRGRMVAYTARKSMESCYTEI